METIASGDSQKQNRGRQEGTRSCFRNSITVLDSSIVHEFGSKIQTASVL